MSAKVVSTTYKSEPVLCTGHRLRGKACPLLHDRTERHAELQVKYPWRGRVWLGCRARSVLVSSPWWVGGTSLGDQHSTHADYIFCKCEIDASVGPRGTWIFCMRLNSTLATNGRICMIVQGRHRHPLLCLTASTALLVTCFGSIVENSFGCIHASDFFSFSFMDFEVLLLGA